MDGAKCGALFADESNRTQHKQERLLYSKIMKRFSLVLVLTALLLSSCTNKTSDREKYENLENCLLFNHFDYDDILEKYFPSYSRFDLNGLAEARMKMLPSQRAAYEAEKAEIDALNEAVETQCRNENPDATMPQKIPWD